MKNPFLAFSGVGYLITALSHWVGQLTVSDWAGLFTMAAALSAIVKDHPSLIRWIFRKTKNTKK